MPVELAQALRTAPFTPSSTQVTGTAERPAIRIVQVWPTPRIAIYGLRCDIWGPGGSLFVPLQVVEPGFTIAEDDRRPHEEGWDPPLSEALRQVPQPVRAALRPLPLGVQWRALQLVAAVPEALDLFRDNPTFGGLLAEWHHSEIDPEPGRQLVREALRRPRRQLLQLLGLPTRRWIVRALAKTDPAALRDPGPRRLVAALNSRDRRGRRWLQHLDPIRADVVGVLDRPDLLDLVNFSLLTDPHRSEGLSLVRLLALVGLQRDSGLAPRRPGRFSSWSELLSTYRAYEANGWSERYPGVFEMPTGEVWLPGDPVLRLSPITTVGAMARQGRQQANCVTSSPSYPTAAWMGGGAMYSLAWDEGRRDQTGTVWLRLDEDGRWEVREVEGFAGGWIEPICYGRLEAWAESLHHVAEPDDALHLDDARGRVDQQLQLPFSVPSSPLDAPAWTEAVRRLVGLDRLTSASARSW